mmetsp:Transcript_71032/g.130942  ORF Transcript_71032/g.130942 Transcript_71032/m.130942 type:complete len:206 (-) Transcript_71032:199-816(-)
MSSMAFFTCVNASRRTLTAKLASRGFFTFLATADSSFEASSRRVDCKLLLCCSKAGLKVLVNKSCASSVLRIASALDTASISAWRVFWRSSHSASVIEHFSLSIIRNCSSAESEFFVSSMSSLACAFFWSVVAFSADFLSIELLPAAISASFAAFKSSYAFWLAISSFCEAERLDSNVSFICFKIPKIWPDCGTYDCLKVGSASK